MAWNIRKLVNQTSNLETDGSLSDDTVDSGVIEDGAIVNADVNASAAIAHTKLAALTGQGYVILGGAAGALGELDASGDTKIMIGNGTTVASAAMSGDVTMANTGAVTIANDAVETAMIKDGEVTEAKLAASTADSLNVKRVLRGDYTFSATTAGSYNVGPTLPDNAIITKAWVDVTTTCAGDGDDSSTIAFTSGEGANDLVSAVAISDGGNPWDEGLQAGIPDGTVANMIKMTSANQPQLVVAINATDNNIASGAVTCFIEYVVSA